jgi:hypothetical protein
MKQKTKIKKKFGVLTDGSKAQGKLGKPKEELQKIN